VTAADRKHVPRLLVVVAHPDDETFGCGSLLLHARRRGVLTSVVCATRGEQGELADGVEAPAGLGALREQELRAAAVRLGVDEVDVLDFVDSGMHGACPADTLCAAPAERLDDVISAAVERHRPSVVVTLDGSDGHRDHLVVRDTLRRVLHGSNIPLYLHGLPRSLMHSWIRERTGDPGSTDYTTLPEIGTPDEQFTTVIDTAALIEARLTAIAEHRSQRSPFEGLTDELRNAFLGREHLTRITPPWPGGPPETELLWLAPDDDQK
jgi:LmbE family N-acetylglucosaminyl deacetylase